MRVRIFSGVIALILLFCLLFLLPVWTLPIAASLLSALAVREFLGATGFVKNRAILICSIAFSMVVSPWVYLGAPVSAANGVLMAYIMLLFALALGSRRQVTLEQIGGALLASLFIPLAFSSVIRIRQSSGGMYLVLLPMIAAFGTDTCAYFTGRFLGHTKMAPGVSPNKTWEGAVGGFLGCIGLTLVFGLLMHRVFGYTVNWRFLVFAGGMGSIAAQLGDLSFSYVKREFGIKDYGQLISGHGGILDRCDSLIFAAPAVELVLAMAGGALLWV